VILCSRLWYLFYLSSFWYNRTTLISLSLVLHPDKLIKGPVTLSLSARLNMHHLCTSGRMSAQRVVLM